MRALSIRQPWAWLIVNGFKDVENRSWPTNFRGRIAVHAGKTFDMEGYRSVKSRRPDIELPKPPLDISARPGSETRRVFRTGGIVGVVTIADCREHSDSEWYIPGNQAFILRDPIRTSILPMNGQLGIFHVPKSRQFYQWRKQIELKTETT